MKLKSLTSALLLSSTVTLANPVTAEPTTPVEQKRGAVGGMLAGAAVGGPVGATLGAILGGEVFGRWVTTHRDLKEIRQDMAQLESTINLERRQHKTQLALINADLDKLISVRSTLSATQSLPIQFRTGSAEIEQQYGLELERIAGVLNRNKDAVISLTGYSDRRGDETANQQLSEDRVNRVKHFLLSKGVNSAQVRTLAYGESRPLATNESLETNFFDRRVVVELNMDLDPQLATR